ncbi:MAG: type IV pilus modification PilV family protein [Acidobacteriota bacterium]
MNSNKMQKGFSLVELLVALMILVMAVITFVPLFEYMAKASGNNKYQSEAAEIAASELEYIRSLPYDSIGLKFGSPSGDIKATETYEVNGTTYEIQRNIWWEDDLSDNNPSDTAPYDYKKIQIRVRAISTFTDKKDEVTVYTKICREGGQVLLNGGGLNVLVTRKDGTTPVKDVQVDLGSTTLWTDGEGRALFLGIDPPGDYQLTIHDPVGMIVRPDLKTQTVTLVNKTIISKQIEVEVPGSLAVTLNPKPGSGSIEAISPVGPSDNHSVTITPASSDTFMFSNLWPKFWEVKVKNDAGTEIGHGSFEVKPGLTESGTI